MEDIKEKFDDLFYKIAVIGRLNLSFIEDIENFCNYYKDHKDFTEYRIKAKSDMSMIYCHHGLFDKSFDIDFELLQENPTGHSDYFNIIGRIAKTSSILMRTDEVKEYVNQFVINENVKHIFPKLHLLDWYALHYPREIAHNDNFEKVFSEIVHALGAPIDDELPLAERVKTLDILNNEGANILHHFRLAYQRAAPELRATVLEEYLNKTSLKYYRDSMKHSAKKMSG